MKPLIATRIQMYREEDGGRHGPFSAGYRPHLSPDSMDEWLGVTVARTSEDLIFPGQEAEVDFMLDYHPEVDYSQLIALGRFVIREGARIVGRGIIPEEPAQAEQAGCLTLDVRLKIMT